MEKRKFIRKVCLLGDGGVGKTSLIRRYVYDVFSDQYIVSFGTKVTKKVMQTEDVDLTLMLWDILGQKGESSLHSAYYKGANAALLVCDLGRESSVRGLVQWRDDFLKSAPGAGIVPIANKADLAEQVSKAVLEETAAQLGSPFILTSAKNGQGVEDAFMALSKTVMGASS
jgi:small GTP-binding protein